MEKLITQTLTTLKPTPTRKLMETCKVRSTRQVGVLSDAEYEFVADGRGLVCRAKPNVTIFFAFEKKCSPVRKLLRAIEEKGRIALIEGQGWVRV